MDASAQGLAFIAAREACVLVAYQDTTHLAIGFGDNDPALRAGDAITVDEAVRRMEVRVSEFSAGVSRLLTPRLITQTRFDALVSLAWNIGVGGLRADALLVSAVAAALDAPHDAHRRDSAGLQIIRAGYTEERGPFNLARRCREAVLFLQGDYGDLSTLLVYRGDPRGTAPESVPMPQFLGGQR